MNAQDGLAYIGQLREDPYVLRAASGLTDRPSAPVASKRYVSAARWPLDASSPLHELFGLAAGYVSVHRAPPAMMSARAVRAVASGGGLHPAELYLITCAGDLFHYDASNHALVGLASNPRLPSHLCRGLGQQDRQTRFAFAIVLTLVFGRSYGKYADFSYLLSATDAGVLLGRVHRLARLSFGEAAVHVDFDDAAINAVIGVDGREESTYAVTLVESPHAADLPLPVLPPDFEPAETVGEAISLPRSASFDTLHEDVVAAGVRLAVKPGRADVPGGRPDPAGLADLCAAIPQRRSLGHRFCGGAVAFDLMNAVLQDARLAVRQLLECCADHDLPALDFHVAALHLTDSSAGLYRLDEGGELVLLAAGQWSGALQAAQRNSNINVDCAAFLVHVVSPRDLGGSLRVNRGYRVQQMLAGAAMDAVMLASCMRGLVAHPVLGFRASAVEKVYGLEPDVTSVAQICVGRVVSPAGIEGPLGF